MKKLVAFLLLLSMLISLTACEVHQKSDESEDEEAEETEETEESEKSNDGSTSESVSDEVPGQENGENAGDLSDTIIEVNGLGYRLSIDKTYYTLEYSKTYREDIVIPSEVNGLPVTIIGDGAFFNATNLKNITIPDSIIKIESRAFKNCDWLTNITIPNSVTIIKNSAFEGCNRLESINIPASVYLMDRGIFDYCYSLKEIHCDSEKMPLDWDEKWIGENNATIYWANVAEERGTVGLQYTNMLYGDEYFYVECYNGTEKDVVIPATYCGWPVRIYNINSDIVENIIITDGVDQIGYHAFSDCANLKSVTIPKSVTCIESWAFLDCMSLTDIYCKAESQPAGWDEVWNCSNATVHWGYTQ